jgi:hypothetical protein
MVNKTEQNKMNAQAKPVLNATKKSFLKEITSRCSAASPTIRNTKERFSYLSYSAKLNGQSEYGAESYLKGLGFVSKDIPSTGGSSRGDFSSDAYGLNLTHPNGVTVSVSSWFGGGEAPTFNISVSGTEEQLAKLLAK